MFLPTIWNPANLVPSPMPIKTSCSALSASVVSTAIVIATATLSVIVWIPTEVIFSGPVVGRISSTDNVKVFVYSPRVY